MDDGERGTDDRVCRHDPSTGDRGDGVVITGAREEVHTDEIGHIAGPRMCGDRGEGAGLYHAPLLEDDDAISERVHVDRVMGDEEANAVEGGEVAAQVAPDLGAGARVERGEWLVEQEKPGFRRERTGKGHTLGLPTRQGAGAVVRVLGQADTLEPLGGTATRVHLGDTTSTQAERDVLEGSEVGEQQVVLEDDGHRALLWRDEHVAGWIIQAMTVEFDTAVVDRQEAGETPEHSALARTIGTEERDDLAGSGAQFDVEVEGAERTHHPRDEGHVTAYVPHGEESPPKTYR